MYYILNETDQVIAADETLLNQCGVAHINELSSKISQEENLLESLENPASFIATKTTLSSTLGNLTLVSLEGKHAALNVKPDLHDFEEDALFSLVEETDQEEKSIQEPLVLDDEPLDLGLEEIKPAEEETLVKEASQALTEISVDIETLSKNIGISSEDYSTFLNEFIDHAIDLETDLKSTQKELRVNATHTLSSLANVLHLPEVKQIINDLQDALNPEDALQSFYEVLSRITTTKGNTETHTEEKTETEEVLELFDSTTVEPKTVEMPKNKKKSTLNSFGTISLEDIKPKHFDFQLEEAANDLSLPVELIEEFVHDFIEQAHIETKKMLEAYEEGDLDAIQKIGHLLKGASSNLRINALSNTLYKIQFTETSDNLDLLIKDYWAHFLSFENKINVISNQKEK